MILGCTRAPDGMLALFQIDSGVHWIAHSTAKGSLGTRGAALEWCWNKALTLLTRSLSWAHVHVQIVLNATVVSWAKAMLTGVHGRQPRKLAYLNEWDYMDSIPFRYFYSTDKIQQLSFIRCPGLEKYESWMSWEGRKLEERSPGSRQSMQTYLLRLLQVFKRELLIALISRNFCASSIS